MPQALSSMGAWIRFASRSLRQLFSDVLTLVARLLCIESGTSWRQDPRAIQCVHCNARYPVEDLPYTITLDELPVEIRSVWMQLHHDDETDDFLRDGFEIPRWRVRLLSIACTILRECGYSLTDSNAILGRGKLFVLSRTQASALLGKPGGTLIDIGAGAGHVTKEMAPLFEQVVATEASAPMIKQLHRQGFVVHCGASLASLPEVARRHSIDLEKGASVVAILNVLDRCDSPRALLRDALLLLKPGGRLLLAVVLPFRPHVEEGRVNRSPTESLGLPRNASFEKSAELLWKVLLEPLGLVLERFARVPYLSFGDEVCRMYSLEDSIWVLRKPPLVGVAAL